ncbi:hypothetical protein QN277_005716 [Acacia crassicarpa]|nr:hypothetical protein QN277_005716 [Acacia crassicarpa]
MKIREDHNIRYIPYDILANILRRLPVKSLIRFQCVSKDWENLIKSPSFIRDCLHHTSRPTPLLLLSFRALTPRYRFQLLDPRSKQVLEIQNPPLIDSCRDLDIVGSCNGLVCLQVFNEKYALSLPCSSNNSGMSTSNLLLWNPTTRQFRKVPRTMEDLNARHRFGFGFSPIDNDYKIVKLKCCFAFNPAQVYSLNSGSWEEVEFENSDGKIWISSCKNVAVNGSVYWLGGKQGESDDYDFNSLVVSIDLTNLVCTSIPSPDLGSKRSRRAEIILYENKLAVLAITKSRIHLWVMEEDTCASRGRWTWTKKYTCSFCSERLYPSLLNEVTIWKNKIVYRPNGVYNEDAEGRTRFCLLDLTTNELKEFVIKNGRYDASIYTYVESHVSVAHINHREL